MTTVDIIQIILAGLTLIVTAFVPVAIFWLQSRHEKEIEKIQTEQRQKDLIEKAERFLIDNTEERDYLPMCMVAAKLNRHEKHIRKIYTEFCRCSPELQEEIIKRVGFPTTVLKDDRNWVSECFENLKKEIETKNLGQDFLYDGEKYFHRGFEYYRDRQWEDPPRVFEPLDENRIGKMFVEQSVSIGEYIDEYYYYVIDKHKVFEEKPYPPIDYVIYTQNLGSIEEPEVCRWMMELVHNIACITHNRKITDEQDEWRETWTDAQNETYEDKYYDVLLVLYYTFLEKHQVYKQNKLIKKQKRTKKRSNK